MGLLSGTLAEYVECVRQCPEKAISFEQKAGSFDKDKWKDF